MKAADNTTDVLWGWNEVGGVGMRLVGLEWGRWVGMRSVRLEWGQWGWNKVGGIWMRSVGLEWGQWGGNEVSGVGMRSVKETPLTWWSAVSGVCWCTAAVHALIAVLSRCGWYSSSGCDPFAPHDHALSAFVCRRHREVVYAIPQSQRKLSICYQRTL